MDAVNDLVRNKSEILENLRLGISAAADTAELEAKRDAARDEMVLLAGMIQQMITDNARFAQDQAEYRNNYQTAVERYEDAKKNYENIVAQIAEKHKRAETINTFVKNVEKLGVISEFDEVLWGLLIESVTVFSKDDIRVVFKK